MTDATELWTVRRVTDWTRGRLERQQVDAPRLTADLLLAHVLGAPRVSLYMDLDRPLSKDELASYRSLIQRRLAGEPTQYLVGGKEFYGRRFQVDARVLIPRPETELLVEAVLRALPAEGSIDALDLCTGSGCIGLTLAAERPSWRVSAADLSADALAVAQRNAAALGLLDRVRLLRGDLFDAVPRGERFALVVANPPYVRTGELTGLQREVRHEPPLALDGGTDGLALIRRLAADAREFLAPAGLLALEIGEDQGAAARELLEGNGYAGVRVERDLERRDRMVFAQSPPDAG